MKQPTMAEDVAAARKPWGTCADCGLPYSDDGWADFVVPDYAWEIMTREDGASLLCAVCMTRRAVRTGLENTDGEIDGAFTSGPFARPDWRKPSRPPAPAVLAAEMPPKPEMPSGWAHIGEIARLHADALALHAALVEARAENARLVSRYCHHERRGDQAILDLREMTKARDHFDEECSRLKGDVLYAERTTNEQRARADAAEADAKAQRDTIDALKAKLAAAEARLAGQEPVAEVRGANGRIEWLTLRLPHGTLLYAAPAASVPPDALAKARADALDEAQRAIRAKADEGYKDGEFKKGILAGAARIESLKRQPLTGVLPDEKEEG